MAGVSVTESSPNIDLNAIVAGGDTFLARIKELQAAKDAVDASYAALKIGKDAAAAYADAQANQASALKVLADAKEEAAKAVDLANQNAAAIVKAAQDQAEALVSAAQKEASGLDAQVASARKVLQDWSDKTTADANNIMGSALSTKAAADKQLADNQEAAKQLEITKSQVQASLDAANKTQAALTAKLEAIKAAAS